MSGPANTTASDANAARPQRRVVCAACRQGDLILAGARHFDTVMRAQLEAITGDCKLAGPWEQGFIDQWGVFMDRKEAMRVAMAAGQPVDIERGCGGDSGTLYSEGLY